MSEIKEPKESKLSKLWTNESTESKLWTSELLKSVNVLNLSNLTPQNFVKCKSMTRDVLANRLCEALKHIDGCLKKIVELKNSYDQLDEASLITFDENIQMVKELEKVKGEAATEVVDLQREVVTLQRDLLAEKDRQLTELRTSVVESVQTTVKEGFKSYSDVLKESCKAPSSKLQTELKTVVKSVVEEEDRSRSFMLFGLKEETEEDITGKVCDVLFQLNLKPKVDVCRIGSGVQSTSKDSANKPRPVKVTVASTAIVKEVLSRAKYLKNCSGFGGVYLSPDRSVEQRAEHRKLVLELKQRLVDQPGKRHFIRGNTVVSTEKND